MTYNQKSCPIGPFIPCEYLGSMFLVIAAISPVILFNRILNAEMAIAVLADALAVGFILYALIEMFTPRCSAYFNPAVSVAMALDRRITWIQAFIYSVNQIAGGLTGMVLSHLMFYHEIPTIVAISDVQRYGGAYIAEILGTFLLVLAIFLLGKQKPEKIAQVVGLLVGGMLLATSSTMFANPQVTLARIFTYSAAGIRLFDGIVFILMEIIGAVLAVAVWRFITKVNSPINPKNSKND